MENNDDPFVMLSSATTDPADKEKTVSFEAHVSRVPSGPLAVTESYCFVDSDGAAHVPFDDEINSQVDQDFRLGAIIHERYLLISNLGRGGMGRVLLAQDLLLGRRVAMKIVAALGSENALQFQELLAREARLGASLNDPGIAAVYDFGVHAGKSFTIFEYVEGQTLRDVLQRCHQMPVADVRRIIVELAHSLDLAHAKGVVHRDLKPENICFAKNGRPKILDFGIARDLRRDFRIEGFCGTPQYASPEQAACSATDGRTDQYALALLAYEMLAGRRVFVSTESLELLRSHREGQPTDLRTLRDDLPDDMCSAIHRALQKNPMQRFATCQEFSSQLAGDQTRVDSPGAIVAVPEQEQIAAYLCQVSDDSLVAKQLASHLEAHSFTTWYYQRDALPGVSFLEQTSNAICKSYALVLLISPAALLSEEFARQILEGAAHGQKLLPLLSGLTLEEFERRQPTWRPLLGAASVISLERADQIAGFDRVSAALVALGVPPAKEKMPPPATAKSARPPAIHNQIWATDASQIDVHELKNVVFRNQSVDEFLTRRNKYFLSGTKGLGKTLLLTFKRHLLSQSAGKKNAEGGLCFVPQGRPFLDFMSELKSLPARFANILTDLNTTKRFWSMALRVSAISNHPGIIMEDEADEVEVFPTRFRRWLKGSRVEPTVVFKELTNFSVSQANAVLDDTETFLDQKLRGIHSSTYFFVDKVDQAVRQLPREAWINIQAGLIEAAWDVMNTNGHIKVFASIRQEAFVNYQSDIKTNLLGATTILQYSVDELEDLMNRLSGCYEACDGFKDFLGMRVLQHHRRSAPEDSFGFVRRHSFGRPRDLVVIASELSAKRASLTESRFSEIVRRISATRLVANVFEEMRVFLDCLGDLDTRTRFLMTLSANIFSRREAVALCATFNGIAEEFVEQFGDEANEIFHPFEDLYLAGLLGVVARKTDSEQVSQKFRQPEDMLNNLGNDLPVSSHYFLHPALSSFVQDLKKSSNFLFYEHVLVGDRLPWEPWDEVCCQIERYAADTPLELRQLVHFILKRSREILRSGTPRNLPLVLLAMPEWHEAKLQLARGGYEEANFWLEELKEFCDHS